MNVVDNDKHNTPGVYFIKMGDYVKIGYSYNPTKRIKDFSTPLPLEIICVLDGGYTLEAELHKKFKKLRTNKEWFIYNETIKNFLSKNGIKL